VAPALATALAAGGRRVQQENLQEENEADLPKDKACPKPIFTDEIDNPIEQLSYLMKPFFSRRVTYKNRKGKSATRDCKLKSAQQLEIAVFMDRWAMTDRLFMQNVRRYGGKLVRQN
jgi:hypothetical protein